MNKKYYIVGTKHSIGKADWQELKEEYELRKNYIGDILFYCVELLTAKYNYGTHAIYTILNEDKEPISYPVGGGFIHEFKTYGTASHYLLTIEYENDKGEEVPIEFRTDHAWYCNHVPWYEASDKLTQEERQIGKEDRFQWGGRADGAFEQVVKFIFFFKTYPTYLDYLKQLKQRYYIANSLANNYYLKEKCEILNGKISHIKDALNLREDELKESDDNHALTNEILRERLDKIKEIL